MIRIKKEGPLYSATIPSWSIGGPWSTTHLMSLKELTQTLKEHGCHPIDIADAFLEADPSLYWREIKVYKRQQGYTASAFQQNKRPWYSNGYSTLQELSESLKKQGFQPFEIAKAFDECDPNWRHSHPKVVL